MCLVHCVYCLTDCTVDDPEHGAACPSVTGRYPVRVDDPHGPAFCVRCEASLTDFFYLVQISGEANPLGLEDAPVYECVCFECKVASEVAA
jgi:hypothetical protein